MSVLTEQVVSELCSLLEEKKYILLNGGLGVGKTYFAKQVAQKMSDGIAGDGNMLTELIPIHSAYGYEDFISGMSVDIIDGQVIYNREDKIFLKLLKSANESWINKKKDKYLIILDDINRGNITGILGDFLGLLEPHGDEIYTIMVNGSKICIPPNFYIIATKNDLVSVNYSDKYSLNRRFYHYYLQSDCNYLAVGSTDKFSAYFLYKKINSIIEKHFSLGINDSTLNHELYLLGHGMFLNHNYIDQIKYQCIPILFQYIKDGILNSEASSKIENLSEILSNNYINSNIKDFNKIEVQDDIVHGPLFISNGETHYPLINLVTRIKQQGLLSDSEIQEYIIENDNILYRESTHNGEIISGNLFINIKYINIFKLSRRPLYKKKNYIKINGVKYCVAGEMQPKEYHSWDDEFLKKDYINRRNSTPPNTILFFIVKNYYEELLNKYETYLNKYPEDTNMRNLVILIREELEQFIDKIKKIKPLNDPDRNVQANYNLEANNKVREIIGNLILLWNDKGAEIDYKDQKILIEGVYGMEFKNIYREYYETMSALKINQMIIQGPPGTSKTYSTKKFLQYIGAGLDNDSYLNDEELEQCQITNYNDNNQYNTYAVNNSGKSPIAWDIVQFHPSYGYEDFVRGIEVSTKKESDKTDAKSFVSYETVNKILGKMAWLAQEVPDTKFFLVVDEINRANLATVFGELIYGLEYRGEAVATPYSIKGSNKLSLPKNLYIIGTMNTADKSIGGIDYAIRRRFLFFSLLPDENVIEEYSKSAGCDKDVCDKAVNLFKNVSKLFDSNILCEEYYKEDVQLGHTYFLVKDEEELFKRFKYQIIPILKEYNRDGMFQLNIEDDSHEGWSGFLKCLTGEIKVGRDDEEIKNIYDVLVTPESV